MADPRLSGKNILLGIGAGISAYRSLDLIRLLKKQHANVLAAPTKAALDFVTLLTLETLSGQAILSEQNAVQQGQITHIERAYQSDLVLIAPATADLMAKMAQGLADSILLQTLLSFRGPLLIAPAMETRMWEHPATQANVKLLKERGAFFAGPEAGDLASGREGLGRMASADALFNHIVAALSPKDFAGQRVLLTAGPTLEALDPVRFLSNHSSGKMGVALAKALVERGAEVHLVHGPLQVEIPKFESLHTYPVQSADQMLDRSLSLSANATIAILCAAVADAKPKHAVREKIKKQSGQLNHIELIETPDILATLGKSSPKPFLVGFAAETSDLEAKALQKCLAKNCDLICANQVDTTESPFGSDFNRIALIDKTGQTTHLPYSGKAQIAHGILDAVAQRLTF